MTNARQGARACWPITAGRFSQRVFKISRWIDGWLEIWEYGRVKTTLEIPDDLFREAKAKAATEGRKLKDVVADALRAAVHPQSAAPASMRKTRFPILKSAKPGALSTEDVRRAEADMEKEETTLDGKSV